jgi:hypothetical protein
MAPDGTRSSVGLAWDRLDPVHRASFIALVDALRVVAAPPDPTLGTPGQAQRPAEPA